MFRLTILKIFASSIYIQTHDYKKRYAKLSKRLKREQTYCDVCFSDIKLVTHHLFDKTTYPRVALKEWNLVVLCNKCHKKLHSLNGGYRKSITPSKYLKFKRYYQPKTKNLNKALKKEKFGIII